MLLKTIYSQYWIKAYVGLMLLLALSVSVYAQNPQANFTHSVNWSTPHLISLTDLSTGSVTSWTWNFGDGTPTSNVRNPTHTYAFSGEYSVSLTVSDGTLQSTVFRTISVTTTLNPIFTKSASIGQPGLEVTLDARASTGYVAGLIWTITPASGVTYLLGTSTSTTPRVKFNIAGTYDVSLAVTDNATTKTSAKQTITITNAPYAHFTWPTPVYSGVPVQFTNESRYPCVNGITYSWTFAGFGSSSLENPVYTFPTNGSYSVKLCVTDGCGTTGCTTKMVSVVSAVGLLTAKFTSTPTTIKKGRTIHFYDASTPQSSIAGWFWHFELPPDIGFDPFEMGAADIFLEEFDPEVTHTFNNRGVFKTRLQVTHDLGTLGVFHEKIIKVQETPELIPRTNSGGSTLSGSLYGRMVGNEQVWIYKKTGGDESTNWPHQEFINGYSGWAQTSSAYITGIRLKHNDLIVQYKKNFPELAQHHYQIFTGLGAQNAEITSKPSRMNISFYALGANFSGVPKFDLYADEVAVAQVESTGTYLYLFKRGTTGSLPCWSCSTVTKTLIKNSTSAAIGKLYLDDRAVVMLVDGEVIIYEKVSGAWNFAAQKKIAGNFKSMAYKENVIMTTDVACGGTGVQSVIARVRERQPSGWVTNQASSAYLITDDDEITSTTSICSPDVNSIEISDQIATVKVKLTTNGTDVYRKFIYRKQNDFWVSSSQTYKANASSTNASSQTSDVDGLHHYGGEKILNYLNYCMFDPYIQQSFTITNAQHDIAHGIIELGGGTNSAQFNSGARVNYVGRSITLKPGVWVKPGAKVTFTAVKSCDELYYR